MSKAVTRSFPDFSRVVWTGLRPLGCACRRACIFPDVQKILQKVGVHIEADLVDERSLFHGELNLVDHRQIAMRNLVVLDDEVAESDVLVSTAEGG